MAMRRQAALLAVQLSRSALPVQPRIRFVGHLSLSAEDRSEEVGTMASPAAASGDRETSIPMPAGAAAADPAGNELLRASAAAKSETRLNRLVRFVALGEWAGNAFGTLAFLWATVVLLGGFCSNLDPTDFWYATAIIFIEAFRFVSYTSSEALNFKRNKC